MKFAKTIALVSTLLVLLYVGLVIFQAKIPNLDEWGLLTFIAATISWIWFLIKCKTV